MAALLSLSLIHFLDKDHVFFIVILNEYAFFTSHSMFFGWIEEDHFLGYIPRTVIRDVRL